ncbi:MAG: RNA methyltransferase [Chitinophagaceae bacterium]
MLSKTQSKYIRSLAIQKFREETGCFIAEGEKIAGEWLLSEQKVEQIAALPSWISQHEALIARHPDARVTPVTEEELKTISTLQSPNKVLLVVKLPAPNSSSAIPAGSGIALDGIRDPGNMGTILRIADWYGIPYILCSQDCVDIYNPKVVQSAMGAHLRVKAIYCDLAGTLLHSGKTIWAALLGGTDYRSLTPQAEGILVIGNEGQGIRPETLPPGALATTIPKKGGAESLNAAISTGILCAHFFG